MIDIAKVLYALGIHDIIVHGSPSSETEFFTQCKKIVGTTETSEAILSTDREDFGITWAEVKAKFDEMQTEYDANQYQRDREPNYPNLAEQFDLLWHAIDADTLDKTSDFYTTLKAVKDAHPKG